MSIHKFVRSFVVFAIVVLVLCAFSGGANAKMCSTKYAGTTSANFLKIGVGARASALGGAFVAIADDATASYWNPAGLPQISNTQLTFMHNNWYQDINYEYLGAAFPVSNSVAVGFGVSYFDYGSFDGYDSDDRPTGTYSAGSTAFSSSGAVQLNDNFSIGLTCKIFTEKIEESSASAYAVDIGALYRTGIVSAGVSLTNLGKGLKYESEEFALPRRLMAGLAVNTFDNKLKFAADFETPNDAGFTLHQGVEYCYENTVSFRTGYSHEFNEMQDDGSANITMGFGLKHSIGSLDYSYLPGGIIGDVHRISFTVGL